MRTDLYSWEHSTNEQEAQFAAIYRDTAGKVYAYCYRRTASSEDAEDATADVYVVAWRRRRHLFSADVTLAWLYAVAHRVVSNHHRARNREFGLFRRIKGWSPNSIIEDFAPRAVASVDAQRDADAILALLTPMDREIVQLRYWEELTYDEIGLAVGLKEGTVRSRLYRVRRSLGGDAESRAEEAP